MEVASRFTERQAQIIEVLRSQKADVWLGRSDVAHALGRNKLNQLDLEALAALEAKGEIEVYRKPDLRTSGFVAQYRMKGE